MDHVSKIRHAHLAVRRAQEAVTAAIDELDRAIADSGLGPRTLSRALGISVTAASDREPEP